VVTNIKGKREAPRMVKNKLYQTVEEEIESNTPRNYLVDRYSFNFYYRLINMSGSAAKKEIEEYLRNCRNRTNKEKTTKLTFYGKY
jgi:hypothetical protein